MVLGEATDDVPLAAWHQEALDRLLAEDAPGGPLGRLQQEVRERLARLRAAQADESVTDVLLPLLSQ